MSTSYFKLVRENLSYELYEGFNKIAIMDEKMDSGWLRYKRLIEEESDLPKPNKKPVNNDDHFTTKK